MSYLISVLAISNAVSIGCLLYMANKIQETEQKLLISRKLLELTQARLKKGRRRVK